MQGENKKGHRPEQGSSGAEKQLQVYPPSTDLSRLQCLVIGLLARAQSPCLDDNDHALAWSRFDQTLRLLVEVDVLESRNIDGTKMNFTHASQLIGEIKQREDANDIMPFGKHRPKTN